MKTKLLLAALVLVLPANVGCNMIDRLKARDALNQGVTAYERKQYDQAEEFFKEAISLDPDLIASHLYLATTYRAQFIPLAFSEENREMGLRAIAAFEEVLEKDPHNSTAMANISHLYTGLTEYEKAKDWHRRRAEVDPTNPDPWYGVGVVNYEIVSAKTGDKGQKVVELEDGEREQLNGLVDEGVEALRKALEIKPDYTNAMEFLNLMYRERAKLSSDEEERRKWTTEADKLALQALELRRRQELEAERARRDVFGAKSGTN